MEPSVLAFRLVALGIALYWIVQIAHAWRKPAEWRPAGSERFPVRLSRDRWIVVGVLGVIAGLAAFAYSFIVFPS